MPRPERTGCATVSSFAVLARAVRFPRLHSIKQPDSLRSGVSFGAGDETEDDAGEGSSAGTAEDRTDFAPRRPSGRDDGELEGVKDAIDGSKPSPSLADDLAATPARP
jgi:hypothetical protein